MSAADLVAQLAAAGTPPELLAAVAQELFLGEVERKALAERREKDRNRQAKSRAVTSCHVTERDVTDETLPPLPPLKVSPDPIKITPPISPIPNDGGERAKPNFPAPVGVEAGQWKAFRQQRKKPLNDRSYLMICKKLDGLNEAGWPPGEMIDLAIERGWETVFEPKDQGNGQANRGSSGRMVGPRTDPTLALVRAARAAQREDVRDYGQPRPALPAGQFG